ncbi:hypothetical protein CQ054_21470 [Ochrobactrum sp. MYb29]|nr:hypothetical protein CQ054_21470 [Ochrobactrum sp. MYb29]
MEQKLHNWNEITVSATIMQMVLSNPLTGETATNRIKQIGFMGIMYQMHLMNMDTTVKNIMEASQLSRAGIFEVANPLIKKQLLVEETVLNAIGRGRATRLYIPEAVFDKAQQFPLFQTIRR